MINIQTYITEAEFRFLIAIILTLVFSMILKKRKGLLNFLCATLILYITFDYIQMAYIFTSIIINIGLLYICKFNEYSLTFLNFIILYIFKLKGKDFESKINGVCDISGVLMLNTIKMSYLGKEFDRNRHTICDLLGYVLFIPGLILGPTCTFLEFVQTQTSENIQIPYQSLCISSLFLIFVKFFENYFPSKVLFEKNTSFFKRLLNLYLYNLGQRCRFYFVWNFSNGCYLLQGFKDMLNIKFIMVETSTSIKDLSQGWNVKTNKWLKECFFDKLKHKSIFFASVVTFAVSALWHGINPGYLIMFMSFCFSIPVIKGINKLMLKYVPFFYPILSRIQMILFVMYFSLPFFLLNVKNLIKVWKSVYFYGHAYCLCGFILYFILHSGT